MARKLKLRRGAIVETRDGSVLVVQRQSDGLPSLWYCVPILLASDRLERHWAHRGTLLYYSHELKVKGYADGI